MLELLDQGFRVVLCDGDVDRSEVDFDNLGGGFERTNEIINDSGILTQ